MEDPAEAAREPVLQVGDDAAAARAIPAERKANVPHLISPMLASVMDDKGRILEVRKLGPMDRLDLAVLTGENGNIKVVQAYCALAFSLSKMDGEAIFPPASYNELRGLVGRLGDEGLNAVAEAAELLNPEMEKITPEAEAATAKN